MSDMKRIYVVEVPGAIADQWFSVHTTEDQDEAVRVAKEEHAQRHCNTRVRQFWVESAAPEVKPLRGGVAPSVDVPLVPFTCLDHRDRVISVHQSARAPRCPDCRSSMVPQSMAIEMDKELKP